MIVMSGALPRSDTAYGIGGTRAERAAATFQSTMAAQLLKPAMPRLVSAFGGRQGGSSETMEQFVSQILSDVLAQHIARRDPFGLTPAVLAEIEARAMPKAETSQEPSPK